MGGLAPTPPETVDAFVGAAHGDIAAVQALLAHYPDVLNRKATWGETALGAAAQTGQVEIAQLLLAAGAPLDICTAAMLGQGDNVARMLPGESAGPNATGAHDLPLLYHAVIRGHRHIVDLLLQHGAEVNAGAGRTPALHGAVMFDQPEMARLLLAHGADPNIANHEGKTPLKAALDLKRDALVSVFREYGATL